MKPSHRVRLLLVGVAIAGMLTGTSLVAFGAASSDHAISAKGAFSALTDPGAAHTESELVSLAQYVGADAAEAARMRVLDRDLGRFNSRLVAFSAQGGRTICYGLLAEKGTDPGVSYCYRPKGSELPAGLAGQHFHTLAPQYYIDGNYGVKHPEFSGGSRTRRARLLG